MGGRQGERREQILQALAEMLEAPGGEKVTTAALAARLEVSEAALYRHFASKAQMFEGLIGFVEETLFTRINLIAQQEPDGLLQVHQVIQLLLGFAHRNRGMTRVLAGDALVHEHERLRARVNQIHDRIEATLRQSLRLAVGAHGLPGDLDVAAAAALLLAWVEGRWQQFARSGFRRDPTEHWQTQWQLLCAGLKMGVVTTA
ncbi:MAG: nucleoid occlusion factor SlmA [Pseudomonadota bacterium]|nr:nucleoid occlusion factor SlmA [Pseudomonadota bacterium]